MKTALAIVLALLGSPGGVDADRLVRHAVEECVRARLNLPQDDVVIEFRSVPALPGIEGMTIRVVTESTPRLLGNVSLPVEVEENGVVVRRSVVSVRIRIFSDRLVALRAIHRHDEMSESDGVLRRVEITALPRDGVRSTADVRGKRASRMIREGSIITESVLEDVPLVRANRPVTIVAQVGNVTVSLLGIAKEDGCRGERILVEKADSHERLKGQVVGASTVAYTVE